MLAHPDLGTVLVNTVVWVVAVLVLSLVISLGLAQLLGKEFFGRKVVRWAVIIPWAASLVITARLFTLLLDYNYGIVNRFLIAVGILDTPIDFLGDDRWTMPSMIAVGVFVTLPFTTYVLLAGLKAIPGDVYEAARVDGASPRQAYTRITLPLLRPALLVASVLNIIYVFNSFPIVYTLNDRNPGFAHDTTITFMYKLAFKSAGQTSGCRRRRVSPTCCSSSSSSWSTCASDGGRMRPNEHVHRPRHRVVHGSRWSSRRRPAPSHRVRAPRGPTCWPWRGSPWPRCSRCPTS